MERKWRETSEKDLSAAESRRVSGLRPEKAEKAVSEARMERKWRETSEKVTKKGKGEMEVSL